MSARSPDPLVRLGHFIEGYPALDLCIKGPSDADFTGPIVRSRLMRTGGVPFAYASGYMSLPAATYTVRVVSGMATSCTTSFLGFPDVEAEPLDAGHRYTIAGLGSLMTFPRFLFLEDDNSLQPAQARLRFIHAVSVNSSGSSTGSLDLGSGSGGGFFGLLSASSYGTVGEGGGQPYVPVAQVTNGTFSVRKTGESSDFKVFLNKVTIEADAVYTATLVTYSPDDMELSLCKDTGQPTAGLLPCQELR
jgi:hypothetical protein